MAAESLYGRIPVQKLREAKARLALAGETIEDWARRNGYPPKAVYPIMRGERMAVRGQSLQIAIKLGLRPDPDAPSLHTPNPRPPVIAARAASAACDRKPVSQLGEAVR